MIKCAVKYVVKLKNCQIGTKMDVVVDIDSLITIVVSGKRCGKICGESCGKIKTLLDFSKNWFGSRYWPPNYSSGLW